MSHVPYLDELAIIAVTAVVVTLLLGKLKLPTVAGLLVSGMLIGPAALGLVRSMHAIEALAEIGVVLLLFTIGLEFSLRRLLATFRRVALVGALQVGLTILVTVALGLLLQQPVTRAVFYGFVVALSSTAIVLRALTDRQELDAPHGRVIVGTLIFQDLCVVPMVLVVPLLGADAVDGTPVFSVLLALGKAAVVVVAALGVARFGVPHLLNWVDRSRSREVFLLAMLSLCIGVAWLTALAGLSLALGAFLAGVIVADTDYGHRAMGELLPLRDIFLSVFFVSLGMLFDVRVLFVAPLAVVVFFAIFVGLKALVASVSVLAVRTPARIAWLAGVGLAQFGEFGFVLARLGLQHRVVSETDLAPLLAGGILSMVATPLLIRLAPRVRRGADLLKPLERGEQGSEDDRGIAHALRDHVIIIGFGIAGKFTARAVSASGFTYSVLELNADTVKRAKELGEPIHYGDASHPETLVHLGIESARALVVLMNDVDSLRRVVATAKRLAPEVPVLIRTRYLAQKDELLALGATEVVAEEVEAGVEVVTRLMRWLNVPREEVEGRILDLREAIDRRERASRLP